MTKISDLSPKQGNVEVEGTITEIGETRVFNKFGKELKVANAVLKDDSGSVKLTLWNDEIMRFSAGNKIKITNGYVNEFQGEKQLTAGKFGSIEKLSDGDGKSEEDKKGSSKKVDAEDEFSEEDFSPDGPVDEELF